MELRGGVGDELALLSHSPSSWRAPLRSALQPSRCNSSPTWRGGLDVVLSLDHLERGPMYGTHLNWAATRKHQPLRQKVATGQPGLLSRGSRPSERDIIPTDQDKQKPGE